MPRIGCTSPNTDLPQIHATIKMQKDLVKFRYIIGSRNCVTKEVAKKSLSGLPERKQCKGKMRWTGGTVTTNPDILIIAETKIDSSVSTSEFLPKSHTAFRKDHTYHSGGVLVAVRNTFTVEEVCIECESTEFICVKITLRNLNPLYVAAFYRPHKIQLTTWMAWRRPSTISWTSRTTTLKPRF